MSAEQTERAYPYSGNALTPAWSDRRLWLLASLPVLLALAAIILQWPLSLSNVDDVALRILLPAGLGFVLAFAPGPSTYVGRIARVGTVVGLAISVFAGDWMPLMLACYPLLLVLSVVLGRERDVHLSRGSRT